MKVRAGRTPLGRDALGELLRRRQGRGDELLARAAEGLERDLRAQLDAAVLRDGVERAGVLAALLLDGGDERRHELVLGRAVVEGGGGAEALDEVEVGRRARRHDAHARGGGELDRARADRRRAAVDEEDLALAVRVGRVGLGVRQREEALRIEARGGGREAEGQNGRLVPAEHVGDGGNEEGVDDGEALERRVLGLAAREGLAVSVAEIVSLGCLVESEVRDEGTHPRTRSPLLTFETPSPTSTTSPATSVPRMNGYCLTIWSKPYVWICARAREAGQLALGRGGWICSARAAYLPVDRLNGDCVHLCKHVSVARAAERGERAHLDEDLALLGRPRGRVVDLELREAGLVPSSTVRRHVELKK